MNTLIMYYENEYGESASDITMLTSLSEDTIYKKIGEKLLHINIPSTYRVILNIGTRIYNAQYNIIKRGKYIEDGVEKPSMYVVEETNEIDDHLERAELPKVYMNCVHVESNNYKYYRMEEKNDEIVAEYGRIGSSDGDRYGRKQTTFKRNMFWIRYFEKLSKGYRDDSELYYANDTENHTVSIPAPTNTNTNTIAARLFIRLKQFARDVVHRNINMSSVTITSQRVEKVRKLLNELASITDVTSFNNKLQEIFVLSPRNVRYISELLASDETQFSSIYMREESLLNAMEALIDDDEVTTDNVSDFKQYGITVYEATERQKSDVMKKLSDQLKPKVNNIYRIIDKPQKQRFDNYCQNHNIQKIKMLWHGSRNENIFSIISTRLKLRPNARITGKMFGQGIYFAPSSMKSFNYTSYRGTTWGNGSSDTAYMALYATAYGEPLNVTQSRSYTQAELNLLHKNCVHARAGAQLRNDEIVFYNEDAMLLMYLVEFE